MAGFDPIADLARRLDDLEAALDDIRGRIDVCHRALILSRAAIGLGVATVLAVVTLAPAYNTATVFFSAFTAVIGGVVWLGANTSSLAELQARRTEAQAQQVALFRQIEARHGWMAPADPTLH